MNDTEKSLKFLELAQLEERFYVEGHTKRVAFYASFVASMFAAGVLGLLKPCLE
jgi:hypothetical protein